MSHQWGRGKAFLTRRETLARSLAKLDESLWLPFVSKCILQTRGLEISPQNRLKRREIFPAREPAMIGFYAAPKKKKRLNFLWNHRPSWSNDCLLRPSPHSLPTPKARSKTANQPAASAFVGLPLRHPFPQMCLSIDFEYIVWCGGSRGKRWLLTGFFIELWAFAGLNLFFQGQLSKHWVLWKLSLDDQNHNL